jgi:hypothetical protein
MNPRRPLSVGETLNEVIALYQRNFGVLIPAAFWLFLGVNIITGIAGNDHTGLLAIGAILTFAVAVLYQGMVVSLVRDVRDGTRDSSVTELLSSVGPVLPTLIGTSILYAIGVAVGFLFFIIPGCILLTIWAVIAPAIVIEKTSVGSSFGRSQQLVRNYGWPVFGTVVVATLFSLIAALILTAIAEAIAGGPILRIVFGTLASTFTAPVGGLVAAVLYYRLRELKGDGNPMMPPPNMPPRLDPDA